ncbi:MULTISPECIES: hypothetical protein [unclassified Bradyrhizobium]|uniref:hypothetical protein n=1 Tax=unclassified Bradyrhizobium TaxID=2631580 RepID=UPI001FFB130E|nr:MULTISPECIES: hypothetical protein [unclassified Bradyrhizobium]MCK1615009.1 hypothetical protein [Bradyrhizobium sp. 163]MCK1761725.1 hypothetical protein [Bradyrhizobium sp. 136]
MSENMASEVDYDALLVLIECMEQTPPLSRQEIAELSANQRAVVERMLIAGVTWNQASSGPAFLSLDEGEFRNHLKGIDNDLGEQTAIVAESFARYLKMGEVPAPYYPWRIAIILRREKRPELEKRFLAAWCQHFPDGYGARYGQLVDRFRKLV